MYELIEHRELSADASTITFSNIPQIYTGLKVVLKVRSARTGYDNDPLFVYPNGISTGFSSKVLRGTGSATNSFGATGNLWIAAITAATATSSTFANVELDIFNYTSTNDKAMSSSGVGENNGTTAYQILASHVWSNSNPITSLEFFAQNGNLVQYSSATLYGVGRKQGIGRAPLAIGGYTTYDNGYWIHSFPSSGSFTPFVDMDVEYLVVAGGGGGGSLRGGGGGAGGYRSSVVGELSGGNSSAESKLSLTASTNYSVVVGAGGTGGTSRSDLGNSGANSSFATITSNGGGGGGSNNVVTALSGGSGGGSVNGGTGGSGTSGQGFAGKPGGGSGSSQSAGGGGGASSEGGLGVANLSGNGGSGLLSSITGTSTFYSGGGGGGAENTTAGAGGIGGGGDGTITNTVGEAGLMGTGGGGGGSGWAGSGTEAAGGAGGSGIVIVRYKA